MVAVYRGKAAPSLAAVSLINASTGTDTVAVCLQRAVQCDARATSKAALLLSLCRLRLVASPLKGSCVSSISWAKSLEGRR